MIFHVVEGVAEGCRDMALVSQHRGGWATESVSRHASWCCDMGGSLGGRNMVLALRPKAPLWTERGS